MKKRNILLSVFAAIVTVASLAEGGTLNRFTDITTADSDDELRIVLVFDNQPKSRAKYFEKSIQIDFPQTLAVTPQKEFDIDNAGIASIKVYQFNPTTARIRIFPSANMENLQKSLSMKIRGNKLVINVVRRGSPILTHKTPPPVEIAETEEAPYSLEDVIRESVRKPRDETRASKSPTDENRPIDPAREAAAEELEASLTDIEMASLKLSGNESGRSNFLKASQTGMPAIPSMGEAIVKVGSALMIVLALVFAVGYGAKKYLGRMEGKGNSKTPIKVLSNQFIGVKKNVTIIEVAGEVLVLGVTNENINLLATYSDTEKVEKFRLAYRTGNDPMGTFKKLPFFSWADRKKKKVSDAFVKQIETYAETVKNLGSEKNEKANGETAPTKEELVAKITGTIAQKLRDMEGATA